MLRFLSLFAVALLAPALLADSISYFNNKQRVDENNIEVKKWNWSKVEYIATVEKADGKVEKVPKSVNRKDVILLTRTSEGGSMSPDLLRAIGELSSDTEKALRTLDNEAKTGSEINREEARFRIASYFAANANTRTAKVAADRLREYLTAYKDGYFLGEAYTLLARMQILGKDLAGARATYREMVRLGPPFDAKAHQSRGELELSDAKFDDALAAFRDAGKAAGSDKAMKARADAYAAWALSAQRKWDEARNLAEPITKDESIDDPMSVDDEAALAIAYLVVAESFIDGSQTYEKGYDAAMLAAYYAWWVGGTTEGRALGLAYLAAKKLESTNDKFKARAEKLRTALEAGYPGELKRANDKLKGN